MREEKDMFENDGFLDNQEGYQGIDHGVFPEGLIKKKENFDPPSEKNPFHRKVNIQMLLQFFKARTLFKRNLKFGKIEETSSN